MKDKINEKINSHVMSILKKDAIDYEDYQILRNELARIEMQEAKEKSEAAANESHTHFLTTMGMLGLCNGIFNK